MKTTIVLFLLVLASSCAVSKNYTPAKKYGPDQLQEDYRLFRNILEESHPSLYWYTSKDTIDHYFDKAASQLNDSLPEYKFRNLLSSVLSQVRCGHTTVRASKAAVKYAERNRSIAFPLNVKIWNDTAVITSSLNRSDSMIPRGSRLLSIENRPITNIVDSFFKHLSTDGNNLTHKYQVLSNSGMFRNMYAGYYGLKSRMKIVFEDTSGTLQETDVRWYNPFADSTSRRPSSRPRPSRQERKEMARRAQRSLRIDTTLNMAVLEVNSFTRKYQLRSFLRHSFKKLRKENINQLVVDMRGNGGGNVVLSNLLTKYIADKPFKIADSLYAVTNKSKYNRYQNHYLFNRLFFIFMTRKKGDGHRHFGLYEGRYFKPRKKNHYEGETYILTGGNTFSAASLFTKALKEQPDVTVVGEETGGGAYGNSAWLIPDVTLPNTGVRFRLP
ncbi:MAG: S41 family peptidase, partial [Flavisolibacter sp.]